MANNEWGTPPELIESARKVMGSIDVDPASNDKAQQVVKANIYYTEQNSGLGLGWRGNVWLNPPYGRGLAKPFINELVDNCSNGYTKQAIVLLNTVYTSKWWRESMIAKHVTALCLPDERIAFINPNTGEPEDGNDRDQIIVYLGNQPDDFCIEFEKYGMVLQPFNNRMFL